MTERAAAAEAMEDGAIDIRALGQAIAARKWWIIVPTLAIVLATGLYVASVRPRYTADAKVFLDNQESYYTRPEKSERDAAAALDPEAVASQVQVVTSREVAREVIRELGMVNDPEFDPLARGMGPFGRVAILLGLARNPAGLSPEERVMETYFSRLQVFQMPKTRVLQIEFISERPELAAKAANAIAGKYIDLRSNVKKGDALKARDWLAETLKTLKPKVEAAHLAVAKYREENGLQRGSADRSSVSQELGDLFPKLADARTAQSEAQSKAALIKRMLAEGRIFEIPDVAKDELIRRVAEQRVNLRAQLALEMRTLLPGHPRIKELQSQVAELETELRAAAQKTARTLENDAALAASKIKFLDAEVARRRVLAGEGDEKDARLRLLEQDAASLDAQYQSAMAKFNDANAREATDSTPPDVRLVSPATSPQLPTFPKKIPMLAVAFLGGLLLSTAIVVTRALLSAPRAVRPIERAAPDGEEVLPVAARIPQEIESEPARLGAPPDPLDGVERSVAHFDELRRTMEALRREGDAPRALICAADAQEAAQGVRLARALARSGRAILVDFDPDAAVSAALGFGEATPGLAELLTGQSSFAEVIHRDAGGRLHVMPSGAVMGGETQTDAVGDILDALSETYDHVIVAGPRMARLDAHDPLLAQVDLVALVLPLATARGQAERMLELVRGAGVDGVVVDTSRPDRRSRATARDAA